MENTIRSDAIHNLIILVTAAANPLPHFKCSGHVVK